jgi:hypothetical protein
VTIAQRVIDQMVKNALIYETETGEALIGLPIPAARRPEPDLVVLETIAPDSSAVRQFAYFEQGDLLQNDTMAWLFDNWNDLRKLPGSKIEPRYDVALDHLGDWHKHPGALTEPSWGDTDTALNHVLDPREGKPYLLVILATVWKRDEAHATDSAEDSALMAVPIKVDVDDQTTVRLDTWYMSRRLRRFVALTATVQADAALPVLPLIGWHLTSPQRLSDEISALTKAGYAISVDEWDTDARPPRELCLTLGRRGTETILIVATQADYPAVRPTVYTVPMTAMRQAPENADIFRSLWAQAAPLPARAYPDWPWTANHTMVELAQAVHSNLGKQMEQG